MSSIMNEQEMIELISRLVSIPSPSGNAGKAVDFVERYFQDLGIKTMKTNKGGLLATIDGKDSSKHRFLTAHVDTLGAMVKEIKADGRVKLTKIGGFPWNMAEGEYCEIETADGKRVTGTVLIHQTSTHVYKDAGKAERSDDTMEVRIDEKTISCEETEALGVGVGDFVSFDPRVQITESGFIKSRHLDDKASVALLLHIASQLKEKAIILPYTTHFFISNNEEIGFGGNANISEETVEYLAVDMGAIGDGQATDEYTVSICAKDSSGPYHYGLRKHLAELAKAHGIGYQIDIYPYYASDASAAIRAGYDIVHGLIGPGIDASHAFERTHVDSLRHTGDLIYHYLQSPLVAT